MPLILPSNTISAAGYDVANSCRFDDGSSDYLDRTPASTGNDKIATFSAWIKRGSDLTNQKNIFTSFPATERTQLFFTSSSTLQIQSYSSSVATMNVETNRVFRDVNAWYHIVVAMDSTQATASDRVKIYVNGVQETSFAQSSYISQNTTLSFNTASRPFYLGTYDTSTLFFDGYMAEVCWIDGTQLDPTSFGETDEDSGIWKPIDVSGLTFGTNGFYLDFEDSSDLGNDVSGNGNDFTVNNLTSIDQTTDTPTNNYCTLNPLDNYYASSTFSEGNLKISTGGSNTTYNTSTFGLTQGKWYWEYKFTGTTQQYMTGIASKLSNATTDVLGDGTEEIAINQSGSGIYENNSTTSYGSGDLASGDIISVALDLDNNNLYFAKNGQWGSGSAWNQTFSTALAYSITDPASTTLGAYFVAVGEWNGSGTSEINMNFGNPPFSISSGNSDDNGYGNFEYQPPSGYLALNTKNLATDG